MCSNSKDGRIFNRHQNIFALSYLNRNISPCILFRSYCLAPDLLGQDTAQKSAPKPSSKDLNIDTLLNSSNHWLPSKPKQRRITAGTFGIGLGSFVGFFFWILSVPAALNICNPKNAQVMDFRQADIL